MKTITTPQGEIVLHDPPLELLRAIRSLLPFGAVRYVPPQEGADFGLVMQCGERELSGVRQWPADCDEEQAYTTFEANCILIAHSLAGYRQHGFSGLLLPCAYVRVKEDGGFEPGIAYFGYPSPHGREVLEYPYDKSFDGQFGHGFTTMMASFMEAMQDSSRETGITLFHPVGLDVRPRLHLQRLGLGYGLIGQHVICLKTRVDARRDPTWTVLRATGITEVFHLPSIPAVIDEDELSISKAPPND